MKTKEFYFELPEELIAQTPPERRGQSRLFWADPQNQTWEHRMIRDLPDLLTSDTVLVFNDSKVRKARVHAETGGGGRVELLFLEPRDGGTWTCLVNKAKRLKADQVLRLPQGVEGRVVTPSGPLRDIVFSPPVDEAWLETLGTLPLPPYIKRNPGSDDEARYQTVFAKVTGSAAAPTAGLHFTPELLESLGAKGIEQHFLTLHVGLGTFLPVRTDDIADHKMHREVFHLSPETAEKLEAARAAGKKILAVGTTCVRTLESAWQGEGFRTGWQSTDIFIRPGYEFQVVDRILTNFHTPESTLLMLVSAFAGVDFIRRAYREAVNQRYRFFSYGDAMVLSSPGKKAKEPSKIPI